MILNLETSLFLNLLFLRKNRVRLTSSHFTRMSMTSLAMLPLAPRIITLFIVVSKGGNNAVDVTFCFQIAISQFSVLHLSHRGNTTLTRLRQQRRLWRVRKIV